MLSNDLSVKLYQSIHDSNEPRVFEQWHASSMAGCPREQYFKRLGIKPIGNFPTAAKMLRWDAGHAIEAVIRPHLLKMFPDLKSNERLSSETFDLTGEYDNYSLEAKTIVEVKSVHDWAFKDSQGVVGLKEKIGTDDKGRNSWGIMGTPYLHHALQNHVYKLLLEEIDMPVERIIYVYISLSGRIVVYDTQPNETLTDNVMRRLGALNDAWKNKTPPDCICKEGHPLYDSVMKYCDYKSENGCCELNLMEESNG